MTEQLFSFLGALIDQTGVARFWWGNVVMIAIGCVMIYLAVSKRYEPDHGGFARAAPALGLALR